jgi:hypothetical protein
MQIMELPMCMKDMKLKLKKEMRSKLKKRDSTSRFWNNVRFAFLLHKFEKKLLGV